MKKIIAVILTLAMVLAMTACGAVPLKTEETKPAEEQPTGTTIANPMTEYSSLEEINSIASGNLCRPGVMGVTDKAFYIIDNGSFKLAQFDFEVNGLPYCFRFAPVAEDISGVWVGEGTAFPDDCGEDIQYAETADMKLARWMNDDGQYVLTLTDNGSMSSETFASIAEELRIVSRGVV